ncbi:MAG: hypothetical protein LKE81_07950 [Acetobacter sp.]|nr:hypothetical protein [Acetobacter sp.]MCH4061332.1 hypothetical protein [Acetobacter sp.]MCH4088269.1 hypothetical protein [Acetobacter sp.]
MIVDQPASLILLAELTAQRRKRRVIESSGSLQVVAADHDVREHYVILRIRPLRQRVAGAGCLPLGPNGITVENGWGMAPPI